VHGDGLHVQGSYFAQGCGYWHGHGIFELRGNRSTLQARRYALGSGVHYAFGHLEVAGNENRILNWGVGPGYGWDRSWGSFNVHGDSNEIQADWGTGTASIGSFSRGGIFGNGNQLRLPDFGSGGFVFDEPAYSAQIIDGNNNLLESGVSISSASTLIRMRNPWGVAIFNGVRPVEKISLEKPTWPELPSEAPRAREEIDLRGILRSAENKPLDERIPLLLDVSATFGLDQATPHQALESLMALPDAAATALIKNVEPAAVEHLIRLRIVVAAYGAASFEAIASTFSEQSAQKQRTLLTLAARLNPDKSLPLLFENAFSGSEQKTHLTALRSLGSVLNRDTGQEPGVRACLEALAAVLKSPRQQRKNAEQLFSRLRLAEAFGLLSTAVELDGSSRLTFFKAGPNDITEMIGVRGATELLRLVMLDKISAQEKTTAALRRLSYYEERVRNKLRVPLANDDVLETVQTLNVLGQIGNSSDASFVAPYMLAKSGRVREMAAVALGRMGEAGLHELNKLFSSMPTARTTVMAALAHSTAGKSSTLLLKGLEDPNPDVRLQALSVFGALPPVLEADRPALVRRAKKILRDETDPSVQLAVQLLN
jgi:HEAT repeat protein